MRWSDTKLMARVRARPDLIAVTILLAVSLAVRVRFLSRPLHGDEMITFSNMVLGRDFGGIIFGPFDSNSHLLNSLIMKAVHLLAGENPALLRLPNLVFILIAIALVYLIGAREFGRVTGFAAALFFSLHPAMVLFSVFGRGYAGMVLFTLISGTLFFQLLRSFSWPRLFLCSITGLLAGASHLFAVNVLVAQALLVVLITAFPEELNPNGPSLSRAATARIILGPGLALALLLAVLLPQMQTLAEGSATYLIQTAFPIALINFLGGTTYSTDAGVFSVLLLALALFGLTFPGKNRALKAFLAMLFAAPVALYLLSFLTPVFTLHPRFFAFLLPYYLLLVAVALQRATRAALDATGVRGPGSIVIRGAACFCALLIALTLTDRIDVPRGTALVRAQQVVGEFVDDHPEAVFLTNDTGFVRVRLRQEENMDRIRSALGIMAIEDFLEQAPTGEVFFIYRPQKRYTESDLIHYQGEVSPDVKYQRDDRLRNYLAGNATLEVDLAPMVQIYDIRALAGARWERSQAPAPRIRIAAACRYAPDQRVRIGVSPTNATAIRPTNCRYSDSTAET
jgi:hypothetical protein